MSTRTVELVSEWDEVPFDGGYDGLQSLSDQSFSGAVIAGPTQLFMLNGTVVGILDGGIEDFDGADGTARTAPHDALPLLIVMQDRADSPRAQYYTEDTPLSEVDRTLEDGNFTGFVELSENVLSGDYYLVYHQGRSMSVAWVGNAERLITGEEAFEQADGEVGIYKVMPADIEPVEIPAPPEPSSPEDDDGASATTGTGARSATAADDPLRGGADLPGAGPSDTTAADEVPNPTDESGSTATEESNVSAPDPAEPSERVGSGTVSTVDTDMSERETGAVDPDGAAGASQERTVGRPPHDEMDADETDSATTDAVAPADTRATEPMESSARDAEPMESKTTDAEPVGSSVNETGSAPTASAEAADTATKAPEEPVERRASEAQAEEPATDDGGDRQTAAASTDSDIVDALETRSIPSLDPEWSSSTPDSTTTGSHQSDASAPSTAPQPSAPQTDSGSTEQSPPMPQSEASDGTQSARAPEIAAELKEREAEIATLEGEILDLSAENEELAEERDRLVEELEEARAEIQRLEEELAAAGGPAPDGQTLSAAEAIDGTNLFIRYQSKGKATLKKAQGGSVDRAAVEENLRLEHHTQFDAENAAVDGEAFEEFLRDTIQYRFVDWLVRNLLYEIRDTGHENAMGVLYDALPAVDRAELNGDVSVIYTEDGEEHRSQVTFDVVVRDRMGNPLVVADINDTRQPATDGQMTELVRNAERVGNTSDSLAAAFLVTSSFFQPEALETAKEATSSGLFSRDKRKSFVNLSRKDGYHLCLLEARNNEFHLAVPEL